MTESNFPGPEELHARIQDFLRRGFSGGMGGGVGVVPGETSEADKEAQAEDEEKAKDQYAFPYTPREIKKYLDRFVVKQDEAKKVLAVAVCDHYNHVRRVEKQHHEQYLKGKIGTSMPAGSPGKAEEASSVEESYVKQNIILLGPTGVGKTYLVRTLANLIGVPMVKADATKFTETGYVGGDVEDLVRDLVQQADGDVALAQSGIIYIDEADKLASASALGGRDVSGRGVQTNLLKLMEETEVPLRSQHDIQSQLAAAFEFQRRGKRVKETINTRHILFIVSGAFDKLPEIISRRLARFEVGFHASLSNRPDTEAILQQASTKDFIDYGLEPEFIGRLPVRVACAPLGVDDLFHVLKTSEGSLMKQYEAAFRAYGIEAIFTDDGLQQLAEQASVEKTGARGLMTVCEKAMRHFKYELPGSGIRQLIINRDLVENPSRELDRILNDTNYEQHVAMGELVREYGRRFRTEHGFNLKLMPDAIDALVRGAEEAKREVLEHCALIFKDFEFGLKLIKQNSGQEDFTITRDVVENADKRLSDWVVQSYHRNGGVPPNVSSIPATS
ncbi:MAG TPA: AAA family ATPase [Candidatus Methylacidiphilales bacterium]|nr:AAA family ATPase [Candidatus Methylacidiphilales bacterium]